MGPVLKGLIELQNVESKLRGMNARRERVRRAVVLQEQKLKSLEETLLSHKDSIKQAKHDIDQLELELKSRDEQVQKYKDALNTARNNKEYASILTELNTNKADNSKLEAKILELMGSIEDNQKNCEEIQNQIEEQKKTIADIAEKASDKLTDCEQAIEQTQEQWSQLAKQLPGDALNIFQRLCDTYDGEAVVFAQQAGGRVKTYSCGGCFMSVTAEAISQLIANDDISQCKNCGRILVVKETEEADN